MIKKTLYFGNPVYLSLRNAQLVIKLRCRKSNGFAGNVEKAGGSNETYRGYWNRCVG